MRAESKQRRPLLDLGAAPVLLIGVTGHRDLRPEDLATLAERVQGKLQSLRKEFPEARLVLMSALAEGADQLVAKVAVEELGLELVVPLPHPLEPYRQGLQGAEARDTFDRLAGKALAIFTVPHTELAVDGLTPAPPADPNLPYAALGRLIASHSDILLALWDGAPSGRMGGTAQVVQYMRTGHGLPPELARLGSLVDSAEHAIIYHLGTPRLSQPVVDQPLEWREPLLVGGSESERKAFTQLHSLLRKMDRREELAWLSSETGRAKTGESLEYLGLPSELADRPEVASLTRRYAEADALALRFQTITNRIFMTIFVLAMLSALMVSAYWNWGDPKAPHAAGGNWLFMPEKHLPLVRGHALLLISAFLAYGWFRWWPRTSLHPNRQHKHLDYRALAEGLRVQFFWRLSGLPDSVSEKYLRRHRSPLDWIKSALRLAYLDACADGPPGSPPRINAVIDAWVLGQAKYQKEKRLVRDEHRLHRLEWASRICFFGGIAIMLYECVHHSPPSIERNAMIFIAGLLPVLAGLFEFYLRVQGYEDHTHEARKTATIFLNAYRSLWHLQSKCSNCAYPRAELSLPKVALDENDQRVIRIAQGILREAGTEALEENCDWFLMHRSREIVVPG